MKLLKDNCKWCGNEFYKKVGNQIYCSKKCQQAYFNKKKRKNNGRKCLVCLEPIGGSRQKYCSDKCANFLKNRRTIRLKKVQRELERRTSDLSNHRKKYTKNEIRLLKKYWHEGKTSKEIAIIFKRTTSAIQKKIEELQNKGEIDKKTFKFNIDKFKIKE